MSEHIAKIPFDTIDRIEPYINSGKLTLTQIVNNKNPDYVITGNFYLYTTWRATCQLKANGVVYADDGYTYRGYSWNGPQDFALRLVPDKNQYANHYACACMVREGKAYDFTVGKDVKGTRGRTAICTKGNELWLYASADGSSHAKTPEKLQSYLISIGVDDAIMGDGGGKVNFYGDGIKYQGKDVSQNLMLIYLKKQPATIDTNNLNDELKIQKRIMTKNPRQVSQTYKRKTGYMQHSTACPGANANAIIKAWDKSDAKAETELIIDETGIYQLMDWNIRTWHAGGSANNTHIGCEICEPIETRVLEANWANLSLDGKSNTTYAVTLLQKELLATGFDPNGVDGVFGNGTKTALIAYQKANGLSADGIAGKGTLRQMKKRKGSYLAYDKDAAQPYFENVYRKAVWTCAYILDVLGVSDVTTTNVLSHTEGYKKGVASNHADVGHWFPEHGKTMDDFRADVVEYRKSGKLPYDEPAPVTPSKPEINDDPLTEMDIAWQKCVDAGLLDGSNPTGNVTRRALATVLVRAGVVE